MNQQQESPPLQQGSVPNRDSRPSESPNKATKGLSPTEVAGAGRSPNPQLMGSVPNRDFHKGSPTNPTLQQGSVPNREADLRNLPTRGLSPTEGAGADRSPNPHPPQPRGLSPSSESRVCPQSRNTSNRGLSLTAKQTFGIPQQRVCPQPRWLTQAGRRIPNHGVCPQIESGVCPQIESLMAHPILLTRPLGV
jgi:hypothetical protein